MTARIIFQRILKVSYNSKFFSWDLQVLLQFVFLFAFVTLFLKWNPREAENIPRDSFFMFQTREGILASIKSSFSMDSKGNKTNEEALTCAAIRRTTRERKGDTQSRQICFKRFWFLMTLFHRTQRRLMEFQKQRKLEIGKKSLPRISSWIIFLNLLFPSIKSQICEKILLPKKNKDSGKNPKISRKRIRTICISKVFRWMTQKSSDFLRFLQL